MEKTKEELEHLKQECLSLDNKLQELSEDELNEVIGGYNFFSNEVNKLIRLLPNLNESLRKMSGIVMQDSDNVIAHKQYGTIVTYDLNYRNNLDKSSDEIETSKIKNRYGNLFDMNE